MKAIEYKKLSVFNGKGIQCILRVFGKPAMVYTKSGHSHRWITFFGVGLLWKHEVKDGLLFSERCGMAKYYKIGKWIFHFLPRFRGFRM